LQRLLLLLLLIFGTLWWISRALTGVVRRRPVSRGRGAPGDAPPVTEGGRMVRDRQCNTFLPRESAVSVRVGGEEHFFCSERCRDAFLERHGG
jgi:YHS domain-containing protein